MATTDRAYTTKAGVNVPEKTEWHNIVAWRGLAEICEKYVHKGDLLYIEGKIQTRSWDGENGQKRYITEIVAEVVELFPKSQNQSNLNPSAPQQEKTWEPVLTPINDDEPF